MRLTMADRIANPKDDYDSWGVNRSGNIFKNEFGLPIRPNNLDVFGAQRCTSSGLYDASTNHD